MLGEWCTWFVNKKILRQFNYIISTSLQSNINQKQNDIIYINKLSVLILKELVIKLNNYHKTNYTERFWKILVGPWLNKFIAIIFNRWSSVSFVLKNYKISETCVLRFPANKLIPLDYNEFAFLLRTDSWNQFIYSEILKLNKKIKIKIKNSKKLFLKKDQQKRLLLIESSRICLEATSLYYKLKKIIYSLVSPKVSCFFINTYLPKIAEIFLQIKCGQFPIFWNRINLPQLRKIQKNRSMIKLEKKGKTQFEKFVRKIIPMQMPFLYLEGFNKLVEEYQKLPWPKNPRFIFTSNSFESDELFKIYTAKQTERGVRYIIGQHGANYGTGLFVPSEILETTTADHFLTWGWGSTKKKLKSVGILTTCNQKKLHWNSQGGLLLIQRGGGNRTTPWNDIPYFREYLNDQYIFIKCLPANIQKMVTVRLVSSYMSSNWNEKKLWIKNFPKINLDAGAKPFVKLKQNYRLKVFTYESTGFLECLSLNEPCLLFFNMQNYPLRKEAVKYYKLLQNAGIYFSCPKLAAKKVSEVWESTETWWNNNNTIKAKKIFQKQFAARPKNQIEKIKSILMQNK